MSCRGVTWHSMPCMPQPHCCLHNLVSKRKKESKKAAHHGVWPLDASCRVVVWHGVVWICLMCTLQPHCCAHNLVSEKKKERKKKERKTCDGSPNGMPLLLLVLAPPHGMEGVVPDVWDL